MGHLVAPFGSPTAQPPAAGEPDAAAATVLARGAELRWGWHGASLLATVGALLGLHRAEAPPDADILWSARYGLDVLSSGTLPRRDSYSWTAAGTTWTPNSWAWNVVLGGAYREFHVLGLWLVEIAVAIAVGLAVGRAARLAGAQPIPTALVFAVLGSLVLVTSPRGQTVGYVFLLAVTPLVVRVVDAPTATLWRPLGALFAIHLVWMNCHSSALIGPAIVVVAGAALVAGRRRDLVVSLVRVFAGAGLAFLGCLVTPYGTAPIRNLSAVRRASVGLVNEWQRPGIGNLAQTTSLAGILVGLLLAYVAWRRARYAYAGLLLVTCVATTTAIRFAPMLAVVMIPELALLVGRLDVRPVMFRRTIGLGLVALLGLFLSHVATFGDLPTNTASRALVRQLPAGCRAMNDYQVGAAVILFRPDVAVSVDSRNDLYGRARLISNDAVLNNAPGAIAYLDRSRVTCVLTYRTDPLVAALRATSGWAVRGDDGVRTLLVRVAGAR